MPLVSLAASLCVTFLTKPWVESWRPGRLQGPVVVCVGLALWVLIYIVFHSAYLVFIRLNCDEDLQSRLTKKWHEIFVSTVPAIESTIGDYVDRVADLQIRISMPTLLWGVVKDLLAGQRAASASLQRTIDLYGQQNELGAFINVLGNQWKMAAPLVIRPSRLIDDPVLGCVALDTVLATVVAQPIVQRLSRVR